MKINVIRFLIIPWFLYFALAITAIVMSGVNYQVKSQDQRYFVIGLSIGAFVCLIANIQTLAKAGIWITHSLPVSLKYSSWPWLLNAIKAAIAAGIFYLIGQVSWMPLMWQAFVIPAVFTLTLFAGMRSLLGPILMWGSKRTFSRMAVFFVSLPVFFLVPVTALFLGQTIVTSYLASQPELRMTPTAAPALAKNEAKTKGKKDAVAEAPVEPQTPADQKVADLKAMAESGQACPDESKLIQQSLTPNGPEDLVYWATKAVKCSDMRSVVGMPKLAKIMTDHPSPKARASAILAMPKFGNEQVKSIGYLLVKRISEKESPEVIEAAAIVLSRLGETEHKWALNRLKNLLNTERGSGVAAKVLVQTMKNEDLVSEYVAENLPVEGEPRERAVNMICELPKQTRTVAEPFIDQVVATIKTGSVEDPAIKALECLGHPGFQAIRKEVIEPQHLQRPVAARALSEMDIKKAPEALETAEVCVQDKNDQVRQYCSQSLGKIGAPALPKILALLKSNDSTLKEAGKNALNYFDDPQALGELERIRAENSGWMANKKKLQIAEAVSTALVKIKQDEEKVAQ